MSDREPSDLEIVETLWDTLRDADPDTVESTIREAGLTDDMQRLLRELLRPDPPTDILDASVDELARELVGDEAVDGHDLPDDISGMRFGAWRALDEIDRGGMGAVLRAERADGRFEKVVALKVIRPGHYTSRSRSRFLDEMRLLARLEHPGIVRLIDGGITGDGIPWFAMEHVEGEPITAYAERLGLGREARIELVIQVCRAIEHAHRNLVVHGDIKPSNILVTDNGQTRVVDFGIGRSLVDEDTGDVLPRFTPRYASPEARRGDPVDTASDVYSLSAVFGELCGVSPGDGSRKDDLAWLLEAGLADDPAKRLSSVAALRQELRRYLDHQPLESHPPGRLYRTGKLLRRHRVPVAAAAVAVIALLAGTAVALQQAGEARREAEKARWTTGFLLELFDEADPWLNQQTPISVNELTGSAVEDLLADPERLPPSVRAEAAALLARVQSRLGNYASAEELLTLQLSLLEHGAGTDRDIAEALVNLGNNQANLDEWEAALASFRRAVELQPIRAELNPVSVEAAIQLVLALAQMEHLEEAREWLQPLARQVRQVRGLENGATLAAGVHNADSLVLLYEGRLGEARAAAARALELAREAGGDSPTLVGDTLRQLAATLHQQGDSRSAIELDRQVVDIYQRLYGDDNPQTLDARGSLAVSLSNLGRMDEAIGVYRDVLEGQRAALGEDSQYVASTLGNIGAAYLAKGEADPALDYYRQAGATWGRLQPPQPVLAAFTGIGFARALHMAGRPEASKQAFEDTLAVLESNLGTAHPIYQRAVVYYAPVLIDLGRFEEAARLLPVAYEAIEAAYGSDSRYTAIAGLRWAELMVASGQVDERTRMLANHAHDILESEQYRVRHALELRDAIVLLGRLNLPDS